MVNENFLAKMAAAMGVPKEYIAPPKQEDPKFTAWETIGQGIGDFEGIRKLALYGPTPRHLCPPKCAPASESARKKWAKILRAAQVVGLETAYDTWRYGTKHNGTTKLMSKMITDMLKAPSMTSRIFPVKPVQVTQEGRDTLLVEMEYDLPSPLTGVRGKITL